MIKLDVNNLKKLLLISEYALCYGSLLVVYALG